MSPLAYGYNWFSRVSSEPGMSWSVMDYTRACFNNDTDVVHYKFNARQPILVIFGKDVAERVCYGTVLCYLTCRN